VDACTLARIAPSLGGVETLIEQPALMSFYELTTEQRLAIGIKDELIRLAVGIEDTQELIADLEQARVAAARAAAARRAGGSDPGGGGRVSRASGGGPCLSS